MITETEQIQERVQNPYEGIQFYPDAAAESRFAATVFDGRKTKTIGFFESLDKAVAARNEVVQHGNGNGQHE